MSIRQVEKHETINQYGRVYSDPPERVRKSGRGIIIENGQILLSHELNTGVYMTPGGGLEQGETLAECCVRELHEETGYKVQCGNKFLTINEYSFDTLYVSNYFICKVKEKSTQKLTDIEIEHDIVPEWLELQKALKIFGEYDSKREDVRSLYLREFTVISKFIKLYK